MDGTSSVPRRRFRVSPVIVLLLIASTSPRFLDAQQTQLRPDTVAAEVAALRQLLANQERRITALETEVKEVLRILATLTAPQTPGQPTAPTATSRTPWHIPSNWERIQSGMSQSQVLSILGPPTSREDTYGLITLFYRGEVSGSGVVSGNVKLSEDRVYLVNKPVF